MRQKYVGDDVRARLHQTIIRYNGHPYLAEVSTDGLIHLRNVANGNLEASVDSDDEKLDISSISIGYVNVSSPDCLCAVYLKRQPLRRFKQGIEMGTLSQTPLWKNHEISTQTILSYGFVDAVLGRFPSVDEALTRITKNGWISVAISRDVALRRESSYIKVYIKDKEVGYMEAVGRDRVVIVPMDEVSYCYTHTLGEFKGWEIKEGK